MSNAVNEFQPVSKYLVFGNSETQESRQDGSRLFILTRKRAPGSKPFGGIEPQFEACGNVNVITLR